LALYGNASLTGNERFFNEDDIIVSKTDLKGKITYVNRTFLEVAGMVEKDAIGHPHNIIRHPEMPRCVFKLLWDTISGGDEIFAYVNNRAVCGDNYWVFAHVTPSKNAGGNIVGYHSNRRVPNRKVVTDTIVPLYNELFQLEKSHSSPKEGIAASYAAVESLLKEKKMGFNEFMFSLGV